jgi:hypothetical protein
MGIVDSPDVFQSKINQLLGGFNYVQPYLDDILIVTCSDHLSKLDTVLQKLHVEVGMQIPILVIV